ncbi:protein kinase [Acidobacteriota bacterium]
METNKPPSDEKGIPPDSPTDKNEPGDTFIDPPDDDSLLPITATSTVVEVAPADEDESSGGETVGTGLAAERRSARRYKRIEELGRQGVGRMYLVYDRDLKRTVLMKMVPEDSDLLPRFLEEAQITGQLEHPNIPCVHELCRSSKSTVYYTTPNVQGKILHAVLEDLRKQDTDRVPAASLIRLLRIFCQVTQAVDFAHSKGVIHRDLKPHNVWLGEHGEVQITNWALSKVAKTGGIKTDRDEPLTRVDELVGTAEYCSPEQASGQPVTAQSDIYSLGVMLYEILTLTLPFEGSTEELLAAHLVDTPEPPGKRAKVWTISNELERICLKALSKEVKDRQQAAGELNDEIQTWLTSETDKLQRRQKADDLVRHAKELLGQFRQQREDIEQQKDEAEEEEQKPAKSSRESGESADIAQMDLVIKGHEVLSTLAKALRIEPENVSARQLLSDYYWNCYQDVSSRGNRFKRDMYAQMIARFHATTSDMDRYTEG